MTQKCNAEDLVVSCSAKVLVGIRSRVAERLTCGGGRASSGAAAVAVLFARRSAVRLFMGPHATAWAAASEYQLRTSRHTLGPAAAAAAAVVVTGRRIGELNLPARTAGGSDIVRLCFNAPGSRARSNLHRSDAVKFCTGRFVAYQWAPQVAKTCSRSWRRSQRPSRGGQGRRC